MKQKVFFFLGLSCLLFAVSCSKTKECTGIIFTYTLDEAGVKIPLGGCNLIIGEADFAPEVKREVLTDASGYYEGTWLRQAYLPIIATKDKYQGMAYINLEPGNVTKVDLLMY